jgi:hypothetical protein
MEILDAPIPSHHAIIVPRKILQRSIISLDLMATTGHVVQCDGCTASSCRTSQKMGGWSSDAILKRRAETRWADVHSRGFRSLPVRILDFGIVLQSPIRWWRSISPARIASVLVCLSPVLRWVVIGSESFLIYCGVSLSTVSLRFISGHATLHFIIL